MAALTLVGCANATPASVEPPSTSATHTTVHEPTPSPPTQDVPLAVAGVVETTYLYSSAMKQFWPTDCGRDNGTTKVEIRDGSGTLLDVADASDTGKIVSRHIDGAGTLTQVCQNSYRATIPRERVYTIRIAGTTRKGSEYAEFDAGSISNGMLPKLAQLVSPG